MVNPINRALLRRGRFGPTYAVLETTGRRTGLARQTPVANGLEGDTFWLISAHGRHAHYVHNLRANARVRVGVVKHGTLQWRSGTAHVLPGDDTRRRQRALGNVHGEIADPLEIGVDLQSRGQEPQIARYRLPQRQ